MAHDAAACRCVGQHECLTQSLDELEFERSVFGLASSGNALRLEALLGKEPALAQRQDRFGYTALVCASHLCSILSFHKHYAARQNHVQCAQALLAAGANVNATTSGDQATALMRAAFAGHLDTVKLLLRHGANTGLQDLKGRTALHKVAPRGKNV
jgi:ankyrin repeat protein